MTRINKTDGIQQSIKINLNTNITKNKPLNSAFGDGFATVSKPPARFQALSAKFSEIEVKNFIPKSPVEQLSIGQDYIKDTPVEELAFSEV